MGFFSSIGKVLSFSPISHIFGGGGGTTNVTVTQTNTQTQNIDFKPILANIEAIQKSIDTTNKDLTQNQSILASNQSALAQLLGYDIISRIQLKQIEAKKKLVSETLKTQEEQTKRKAFITIVLLITIILLIKTKG